MKKKFIVITVLDFVYSVQKKEKGKKKRKKPILSRVYIHRASRIKMRIAEGEGRSLRE